SSALDLRTYASGRLAGARFRLDAGPYLFGFRASADPEDAAPRDRLGGQAADGGTGRLRTASPSCAWRTWRQRTWRRSRPGSPVIFHEYSHSRTARPLRELQRRFARKARTWRSSGPGPDGRGLRHRSPRV